MPAITTYMGSWRTPRSWQHLTSGSAAGRLRGSCTHRTHDIIDDQTVLLVLAKTNRARRRVPAGRKAITLSAMTIQAINIQPASEQPAGRQTRPATHQPARPALSCFDISHELRFLPQHLQACCMEVLANGKIELRRGGRQEKKKTEKRKVGH